MAEKMTTEEIVAQRAKNERRERTPISVLVDNVRSLDNVGMLFRLCDLAKAHHLYLTGYTGHPRLIDDKRPQSLIERHERRINKTAVYALPYQPWSYHPDPGPVVNELKEAGVQIVVLEQTKQSISYTEAQYSFPTLLIVGHEREGVRQELVDLADTVVEIPVLGHGNSHNVATATGIVVYKMLERIKSQNTKF